MKKILIVAAICALGLTVLIGYSSRVHNGSNNLNTESRTDYLPDLNDDYAYLCVEVISKDYKAKAAQVKVADFGLVSGVNVGEIPVNSEGSIDCSDLLIFTGIKDGTKWIISYKDENQKSFPIRIYSLENLQDFSERLEQQKAIEIANE